MKILNVVLVAKPLKIRIFNVTTQCHCCNPQEVQNQLKKLTGELGERESSLKQQYQELLEQTKRRLQGHEVTIQRLTTCLTDKEQQLQVERYNAGGQ